MIRTEHIQILLLLFIVGFLVGPTAIEALQKDSADTSPIGLVPVNTKTLEIETGPFSNIELEAQSVYVWDIALQRKLYGKNDHIQLPLASVSKMMMALIANDLLPPDAEVTVRASDLNLEGDSGLLADERWTLENLLNFTLVASSND